MCKLHHHQALTPSVRGPVPTSRGHGWGTLRSGHPHLHSHLSSFNETLMPFLSLPEPFMLHHGEGNVSTDAAP